MTVLATPQACRWDEGCDRSIHGGVLCKSHGQKARRNGLLDQYRMPERPCKECGDPLPEGSLRTRLFCSRPCQKTADYRVKKDQYRASHKLWAQKNKVARAAKYRPPYVPRECLECAAPSNPRWPSHQRYCSKACSNRAYLRERPHLQAEYKHRRRARFNAANIPGVSAADWQKLVARYGGRCAYCRSDGPISVDHIIPLVRGGRHSIGNVLPACMSCNSSKKDLLLADWRHRILPSRLAAIASC